MAKVDLHVHSLYSARPSEWFLQRLGTRESYTDPETIYCEALKQGMDFVTITDHNTIEGALILKERHPDRVFTGVEATTYFPETGCKVHLLVYGLNEEQFAMIDRLRPDIYQLRDYVREQALAHSVAHATYSINNRLTFEQIEKLLLLFDGFEVINGSRSRHANLVFQGALAALTPEHIERLSRTHGIEPFSDSSWRKTLTGGTDDHAGLFIGRTYTDAVADTPAAFLQALRCKETTGAGRHNDYRGLAFSLYKIAYDFSCSNSTVISSPLLTAINRLLFDKNSLTVTNRFALKKVSYFRSSGEIERLVADLIDTLQKKQTRSIDETLEYVHTTAAHLCDELFKQVASAVEKSLSSGSITGLMQSVSSALPGLFLALPFFSSLNILFESRALVEQLSTEFADRAPLRTRKTLVLTDARYGTDCSDGLFEQYGRARGCSVVDGAVITCGIAGNDFCPTLPAIHAFDLPFGTRCSLHVPSVLHAVRHISERHPDEIVVTSPGPMGLLGLLVARLLHVPCVGVRDEAMSRAAGVGDDAVLGERYFRWFYSMTDTVIEGFPTAAPLNPFISAPYISDSGCTICNPFHIETDLHTIHGAQAV
jgi:hypothetical protein